MAGASVFIWHPVHFVASFVLSICLWFGPRPSSSVLSRLICRCRAMADQDIAHSWLGSFSVALETRDYEGLSKLFAESCAWRDLLSFTWDIQTTEGKRPILEMVSSVLDRVKPHSWVLTGVTDADGIITAQFVFQTACASCIGQVKASQRTLLDLADRCPSTPWARRKARALQGTRWASAGHAAARIAASVRRA